MMKAKSFVLLMAGLALMIAAGCAKPAVRKYPEGPAYDKPMSSVGPGAETKTPSSSGDPLLAAVAPLAGQASRQMAAGELDKAESTVERALRIQPNSPELWRMMAEIQMEKGRYSQAEQFAAKSNLYAGDDKALRAKNWRLIAESLKRRSRWVEADRALGKARKLESQ